MASFKHLPIGSVIGTGDYVFRHFGSEALYIPFTPPDTNKFPTTLTGFYAEPLEGKASGGSTSYHGSVYAKPWISKPAKKLGRAYSSIGNYAPSFSVFKFGDIAIGYSSDSVTAGTQALNVWWEDLQSGKSDKDEANAWINEQNSTILYELFTPDDSEWKAVTRKADNVHGYYNEATDVFVPVKNMDAEPENNMFLMSGNPFSGGEEGEPGEE